MKGFLKKLRFLLLYSLYLLVAIALIDYFFFYRPYFKELEADKGQLETKGDPDQLEVIPVRHADGELMKLLGRINDEKDSAFVRFDEVAPEGALRICACGDSYTFGDEVDESHDYATRLQAIFRKAGAENVEAVNFGVAGFGFHQTYILWDHVARNFDCDVVLLGPRGFQPIRDTVFGYLYGWSPYYLHARYVLDGADDVKLVEVIGDTYGERFRHHFRFFPHWRYLRYDRKAPMFLRSLIPRDRELANPFYYDKRAMEEEAFDTYRILLGHMADAGTPVLIGHYRPEAVDVGRDVGAPNLTAADFYERLEFPYLARVIHGSTWANDLLARQFFRWLTGRTDVPLEVLETGDIPWVEAPGETKVEKQPLSSYSKIEVALGEVPIGQFSFNAQKLPLNVQPTNTRSLVAFKGTETNLTDACFIALDIDVEAGMKVEVRPKKGEQPARQLGKVALLDPNLNIGVVEVEGLDFPEQGRLFFRGNPRTQTRDLSGTGIDVTVGGQPALEGFRGREGIFDGYWLTSQNGRCRLLRGNTDGFVDPDELEPTGVFDLVLTHFQDGVVRVPLATWTKVVPEDLPDPGKAATRIVFGEEGASLED